MWNKLRIGLGHDTHRLAEGGPLRIGGIDIPHSHHAVGHSDADVLLHAITDALLGATGKGDIGRQFPNTDPANKNRDSREMLALAWHPRVDEGWRLINLDCVVFAESPKMAPFWEQIGQEISQTLTSLGQEISVDQIGIKAKTGEKVGPIGTGEAVGAEVVALVIRE